MITSKQDILFWKAYVIFSDGSPAQYKNYNNFKNLLIHEKDFGMKSELEKYTESCS